MPSKKRYKIRTRLRTASKVQEKQITSMGKWLTEHPGAILPKCEFECSGCNFKKLETKLEFIVEHSNNPAVLKRLARRGDQLLRAFAATLLLASQEKTHYLGVAKGPEGDIPYMLTPDAKVIKEKLIGLQYFKDPHLRLLAYADIAKKRRVAFYSAKDEFYCTPLGERPPKPFIDETIVRLQISQREKDTYSCNHCSDETGYLEIDWKIADTKIRICINCLREERNTVSKIAERIVDPQMISAFSVKAKINLECLSKCEKCVIPEMYELLSNDKNDYINGKLSDRAVYALAFDQSLDTIRSSADRILVMGNKCYGSDSKSFAASIAGNDFEEKAIVYLLDRIDGPIVLPEGITTNKFLAQHWDKYGSNLVADLLGIELSKDLRSLSNGETPLSLIEKMMARQHAGKIKDSLPKYRQLGKYAAFVDSIVRNYKISGKEAALKLLELSGTEDTRQKSIGLAFNIALEIKGKEWQYSREEVDFAKHLSQLAKRLLESEGDDYDSALREFIRNAGVTDEILRIK